MSQLRTMTRTTGARVFFTGTFEEATDRAIELAQATGIRKVVKRSPTSAFDFEVRDIDGLVPA
jgi:L-lactate utilization protein LutB